MKYFQLASSLGLALALYVVATVALRLRCGCAVCGARVYPEAGAMRKLLVDLGVPRDKVLLENKSRNTRENAVYSAALLRAHGFHKVLLVTSAFHMRRARVAFRAVGVAAVPASTDFRRDSNKPGLLAWLPDADADADADALAQSAVVIKEYLGYWVYRWRGWIVNSKRSDPFEYAMQAARFWFFHSPHRMRQLPEHPQ